jgi:hypothetical protein
VQEGRKGLCFQKNVSHYPCRTNSIYWTRIRAVSSPDSRLFLPPYDVLA